MIVEIDVGDGATDMPPRELRVPSSKIYVEVDDLHLNSPVSRALTAVY